jgi:hypothetical protein
LEGGLLPLISLTCLHFFIKYGDIDNEVPTQVVDEPLPTKEKIVSNKVWEKVKDLREDGKLPEISEEDKLGEPSALAFTQYEEPSIDDNVIFIDYPEENDIIPEKIRIKPGVLPDRPFNKLRGS